MEQNYVLDAAWLFLCLSISQNKDSFGSIAKSDNGFISIIYQKHPLCANWYRNTKKFRSSSLLKNSSKTMKSELITDTVNYQLFLPWLIFSINIPNVH